MQPADATPDAARAAWRAKVITLFPDIFPGPLGISLTGDALRQGLWALETFDLRTFGIGRHRNVDDTPAGGGAGMVLRADVVAAAVDTAQHQARNDGGELPVIVFTPRGAPLTQSVVRELAAGPGAILLAGRFEGVDERVIEARQMREISIGDYILAGGDLPAMVLIEAVLRLLPGVLGSAHSLSEESFETGLLEYPQYTRPREWEGRQIPDVLLNGNHAHIEAWRRAEAEAATRTRRPDLWQASAKKQP
ncbi:MAG: tRNA (guanosine(37)-N1)-methyltransferase TrmD [Hyphomicrobiales bacterium]|nr:MAG: tRNA (guanosine(37)-N1)-methyltransferase TrmD [Hyphomicrobiales bacterium]